MTETNEITELRDLTKEIEFAVKDATACLTGFAALRSMITDTRINTVSIQTVQTKEEAKAIVDNTSAENRLNGFGAMPELEPDDLPEDPSGYLVIVVVVQHKKQSKPMSVAFVGNIIGFAQVLACVRTVVDAQLNSIDKELN